MGKLQFIAGDATANHHQSLCEEIKSWQSEHPTGKTYIIVPNNLKYELEIQFLRLLSTDVEPASVNTQIFSFSRLAWYFLQEANEVLPDTLTTSGVQMILRQILRHHEGELVVFRGELNKSGFIEKLSDLVLELALANIQPDDLLKETDDHEGDREFNEKMADFTLIYQYFLAQTSHYSLGTQTEITWLDEHLAKFDLSESLFVVTGFERLAAKEEALLIHLAKCCDLMVLDLIVDGNYATKEIHSLDLFAPTAKIYRRLYQQLLGQVQILTHKQAQPAEVSPGLNVLNYNWQVMQGSSTEYQPVNENVNIWQMATIQDEVEVIAGEIQKKIAEGYRYSDIVILTRDLMHYGLVIPMVFKLFDIPYNISKAQSMTQHPLTVLLDVLFSLLKQPFRYRDVMRFLRTELLVPLTLSAEEDDYDNEVEAYRQQVDLTENVMLAYGYEGYDFLRDDDWEYLAKEVEDEREQRIQAQTNAIRRFVRDVVTDLQERFKQVKTNREAAFALYQFLIDYHVDKQILNWRYQAQAKGDLLQAKIQEQTWSTLVSLLDEYVDLMGMEPFDQEEFQAILLQGMEAATYSHVPTTLDQVAVMDLVRRPAVKKPIVFIVGATNTNLPKQVENQTLLSDKDREFLAQRLDENRQYLLQSTPQQMQNEPLLAYLAMMTATETLYLTYAKDPEIYANVELSPYVQRLAKHGGISIEYKDNHLSYDQFEPEKVTNKRYFIEQLGALERAALDNSGEINRSWQSLARIIQKDEKLAPLMKQVLASLDYQNKPTSLPESLVESLYGKDLYSSVSQFETFHECSYRYYLQYGLHLQEREHLALSSAAMGEFFHETLDRFIKDLEQTITKIRLADYKEDELMTVAGKVMNELLKERQYDLLQRSPHMKYLRHKMQQIIYRVIWAMRRQSQHNQSVIRKTELVFGHLRGDHGLKTMQVNLDGKHSLYLCGKIDRIDTLTVGDKTYMTVLDYKSSRHDFSFSDAYYGLAMQLLTYLDVAMTNSMALFNEEVIPAGALYFWLQNPKVNLKETLDETLYQQTMLKQYQQKGILLDDQSFLSELDQQIEPGDRSSLYTIMQKKDETYVDSASQNKKLLSADEMKTLLRHNEDNFIEAGQKIYQGEIELNPYRYEKEKRACTYCPFRSICQFDPMLKENHYRHLEHLKREEVMERLKGEAE